MKRIFCSVFGFFMVITVTNASGNTPEKSSATVIIQPSVSSCNFTTLRGHRKGSGASITWSIDGTGVNKFKVSRTYDFDPYDPYAVWEDAGTVMADNSRSYKMDDDGVFPGIIHYKITAVLEDGSTVCSDLIEVTITKKK